MEPLTWLNLGVSEEDAEDAFKVVEDALYEAEILFDLSYDI